MNLLKKIASLFILICISSTGFIRAQSNDEFSTWWENSGYLETPRYDATIEYCKKLADASPLISYHVFGESPQGRDLPFLILDKNGFETIDEVNHSGKLKVLIQACIHAGETEGKDAGMVLFRDIAINHKDLNLDSITILFIPIFNVDGHERFSPYTRINQNGPKEAGWRTTATNLNLNRDFLKADASEMQAWLRLFNEWDPDFFIDCHTTDGADYQYPVTIESDGFNDKKIGDWLAVSFMPELSQRMNNSGYPVFDYVTFREWHNPQSGLVGGIPEPRFSNGYVASRNRMLLLIETHMLKDYKTRVIGTYTALTNTLSILANNKSTVQNLIQKANSFTASADFRKDSCILEYTPDMKDSAMVTFKGYEYSSEISDLTGGKWFRYSNVPKDFLIPMYNKQIPTIKVKLPEAYIIPVEWQEVISKLELHGITYKILDDSVTIPVETYRFSDQQMANYSYEGRQTIEKIGLSEISQFHKYPKGSVLIDMNQPNARLIAFMFEPVSEESFLRWGFFNSIFEEKEYVETYVMEKMAREMIKENPELKVAFDKLKAEDKAFAENSYAQLIWFYRQTPYYDKSVGMYPVGKIVSREVLNRL
jgi:hypothetical protein